MDNVIYYYSGRGNSLSVARGLAMRMEPAEIKSMASEKGEVAVSGGRLGLVVPVVDLGLPNFVRKFVRRLRCTGEKPHVYAVITCGGMPGASMQALARLLRRQGLHLAAGEYIVFGLERIPEEEWQARLDSMAAAANEKKGSPLPKASLMHRLMTGLINPLARRMVPGEDKKFRVDGSCDGCGACQKVCPVENIELVDGKPVWLHHCEQCAACFSWCPKAAISGTCLAARTHYTNPHIELNAMLEE